MIKILYKVFPRKFLEFIFLIKSYSYDLKRFFKFSAVASGYNSSVKLEAKIIEQYHSIEKGLTMPDFRLGFGKVVINSLIRNCLDYNRLYGNASDQVIRALDIISEYERIHSTNNFQLDSNILSGLNEIKLLRHSQVVHNQELVFKSNYFANSKGDFKSFSSSRSSIREYSLEFSVDMNVLEDVVNLAKSAPSACNRQSTRVYIYTNKDQIRKILEIQGGTRGFGHLANKLIIITSELGVWGYSRERNQSFVDGGIFAMNILYGLHYYNIGACILNCSLTPSSDKKLRNISNVKESESFICMVSCGIPPDQFKKASSLRHSTDHILTTY